MRSRLCALAVLYLVFPPTVIPADDVVAPLMEMVRVDPGTFQMGSAGALDESDERPVHAVTISRAYLIGKYEVTFSQYDAFCAATGKGKPSDAKGRRGKFPVINVSWNDAVEFCNWLSRQEGLTPSYGGSGAGTTCDFSADGYRLPTEAEWEFAARGGTRSRGYYYAGSNNFIDVAVCAVVSGVSGDTKEVGTKAPNEIGTYDMSGNVYEWCWDWYLSYPETAQTDPTGPTFGRGRIARGASANQVDMWLRTSNRAYYAQDEGNEARGFRVVRLAKAT
jgi:formylglycine-generating enzyme required for sulfatase activity